MNLLNNYYSSIEHIDNVINNLNAKRHKIIQDCLTSKEFEKNIHDFLIKNFPISLYFLGDDDYILLSEYGHIEHYIDLEEITKKYLNDSFLGTMFEKINCMHPDELVQTIKVDCLNIEIIKKIENYYDEWNPSYGYYINKNYSLDTVLSKYLKKNLDKIHKEYCDTFLIIDIRQYILCQFGLEKKIKKEFNIDSVYDIGKNNIKQIYNFLKK